MGSTITLLTGPAATSADVLDDLRDALRVWDGAIDLRLDMADDLRVSLESDAPAAEAVSVIVRECVTNAANAGGATTVDVAVARDGAFVRVEVIDNGELEETGTTGLGSALIAEHCQRWERARAPEGTRVTAWIRTAD